MLSQLNEEEKIAMAGIVKWIISADHDDSMDELNDFFKDNNFGDYESIYDQMDERFDDVESFKDFLSEITNKQAQKLLLQIANDIILTDSIITPGEKEVISTIKKIWQID